MNPQGLQGTGDRCALLWGWGTATVARGPTTQKLHVKFSNDFPGKRHLLERKEVEQMCFVGAAVNLSGECSLTRKYEKQKAKSN